MLLYSREKVPRVLASIKRSVLLAGAKSGFFRAMLKSGWRSRRLLILCYHGISLDDEHLWRPGLYMPATLFRRRMETLKRIGAAVLGIDEGLNRLYAGTLPKGSVAITFDDGNYDFYRAAMPILQEFGFPATAYLTTYYMDYNRPVFDPMCRYLLWKSGEGRLFRWNPIVPNEVRLDEGGRNQAAAQIMEYVARERLSGVEKNDLLAALGRELGVDYASLCSRRLLHVMTPAEVREAHTRGIDIELHTHSHRVPREESGFRRQILTNRERIKEVIGVECRHFCYPSGQYEPEFVAWLQSYGIRSATTCDAGIASAGSNALLLPRLLDGGGMSDVVFEAWVAGVGALLPRRSLLRRVAPDGGAKTSTQRADQ